ncbi:HIRAN domain-containing protein [Secundilactobacillus folii]|uniref:HIRAN domain-containing protein n=1 Tax=Secundilactobacillus folii TaxID=2678357 RepID=UPI0031B5A3EB
MVIENNDLIIDDPERGYEINRHFLDFHIAGFGYADGLDVIDNLTLGQPVQLVLEPDNPYDPQAIAIYFKDVKLGYVPRYQNDLLSKLLFYGYGELLEARIQMADLQAEPKQQFRVAVRIKDGRGQN